MALSTMSWSWKQPRAARKQNTPTPRGRMAVRLMLISQCVTEK